MKSFVLGQIMAYNAFAFSPFECLKKSTVEGGPLGTVNISYKNGEIIYTKTAPTSSQGVMFSDTNQLFNSAAYKPG